MASFVVAVVGWGGGGAVVGRGRGVGMFFKKKKNYGKSVM